MSLSFLSKSIKDYFLSLSFHRRLKKQMEQTYDNADPWSLLQDLELVKKHLSQYNLNLPTKSLGLDVGCGEGHMVPLCLEWVSELDAIDISAKAIARAQANYGSNDKIHFSNTDILSWLKKDKSYDLILLSFVLDYFGFFKIKRTFYYLLFQISKSLRKQGYLVILNPLYKSEDIERIKLFLQIFMKMEVIPVKQEIIKGQDYDIFVGLLQKK